MSGPDQPDAAGSVDLIVTLASVGAVDQRAVGTKAANLGDLAAAGYLVPEGFVVTVEAFRRWRRSGASTVPTDVARAVRRAYATLSDETGADAVAVAVRSSATDEDRPSASFAGVYDSYLDVVGGDAVVARVLDCWSSLTTSRATAYRAGRGSGSTTGSSTDAPSDADAGAQGSAPVSTASRVGDPGGPEMAVLVQVMAPADRAGVALSEDPRQADSGRIVLEVVRGRGTAVVGGAVVPDRYVVEASGTALVSVEPGEPSAGQVLSNEEALGVARVVRSVADHRGSPQDVELAVGPDGRVWILQARPLTHRRTASKAASEPLASPGVVVITAIGASPGVATGAVRVLHHSSDAVDLLDGEVLVAPSTDPGWIVAMRVAAAIVTDVGGVTSHAAIVSRELGLPCVVGAGTATADLVDGDVVIVDGAAGTVSLAARGT